MTNKWYKDLTPTEKAKTLLIGEDLYAFFHSDPETVIDCQGMSSPITMQHGIEIVNSEDIPLYIRIVATVTTGDPAQWTDLQEDLGSVVANGRALFFWTPNRTIPATLTSETLEVTVQAFKDAGYTNLYGEDSLTWNFTFFDHSWESAVIIDEDDFENTLDGWVNVGYSHFEPHPSNPYKGAYSLRIAETGYTWTGEIDSSGQMVPVKSKYGRKSFTIGDYSKAFIVFHYTRNDAEANTALRVHYDTKDYIIRTGMPQGSTQVWRCAIPIPVNATTEIRISVTVVQAIIKNAYLDDFITVAFA